MAFIRIDTPERGTQDEDRPLSVLLSRLGFSSVRSFAESIPSGKEVIDVGAGLSRLGHEVAAIREDVRWVNFDTAYARHGMSREVDRRLGRLASSAPDNLSYVGGSVLHPPEDLFRRFGMVYSYWVLPHLVKNDVHHGLAAAWNMLQMGEPGGTITVGPMRSFADNAQHFVIPDSPEETIGLAVGFVKPWIDILKSS